MRIMKIVNIEAAVRPTVTHRIRRWKPSACQETNIRSWSWGFSVKLVQTFLLQFIFPISSLLHDKLTVPVAALCLCTSVGFQMRDWGLCARVSVYVFARVCSIHLSGVSDQSSSPFLHLLLALLKSSLKPLTAFLFPRSPYWELERGCCLYSGFD